jgi:hypothetical protein
LRGKWGRDFISPIQFNSIQFNSIQCKLFCSSNEVSVSETLNGCERYTWIAQNLISIFNWQKISTSKRVSEKTWWHFTRGFYLIINPIHYIIWFHRFFIWIELYFFYRFMHLLVECHHLCLQLMLLNWKRSILLTKRLCFLFILLIYFASWGPFGLTYLNLSSEM